MTESTLRRALHAGATLSCHSCEWRGGGGVRHDACSPSLVVCAWSKGQHPHPSTTLSTPIGFVMWLSLGAGSWRNHYRIYRSQWWLCMWLSSSSSDTVELPSPSLLLGWTPKSALDWGATTLSVSSPPGGSALGVVGIVSMLRCGVV
jgi:hypothetical protein